MTPHHLLTHTGGTGDIFGPQFIANRTELRNTSDYLGLYGTRGLQFTPGAQHVYSNYGFMLLGALVERVSGKSYDDHVAARVLAPAGMTATGTAPEDSLVPGRAVGYMRQAVRRARVERADAAVPRHAGGGRVLHRRGLRALRRRGAGAPTARLDAHGAARHREGAPSRRGFSTRTASWTASSGGRRFVGHGGGAAGMNGDLAFEPNGGYVVVVLSNLDPPAATQAMSFILGRLPAR